MNVIDTKKVNFSHLNELLGGHCNPTGDFMIGMNIARNDVFIKNPYSSPAATILLCTKGNIHVNVNTHKHHLTRGSLLLYGEGSIVEYYDVSSDMEFNAIIFSRKLMEDTMIDLKSVIPIFKYVIDNIDELLTLDDYEVSLLEKFMSLMYDMIEFGKMVIVRDVFAGFVRTMGEMYNKRLDKTTRVKTRQEDYFEKFIRQVHVHYRKERSVKFYADALHITPKYLSTIIKEISGRSAASWINDFVIQQAKILLRFSGKSIQEITYELNFSTQSFFGKYFKRHTGMSPSEYRQSD